MPNTKTPLRFDTVWLYPYDLPKCVKRSHLVITISCGGGGCSGTSVLKYNFPKSLLDKMVFRPYISAVHELFTSHIQNNSPVMLYPTPISRIAAMLLDPIPPQFDLVTTLYPRNCNFRSCHRPPILNGKALNLVLHVCIQLLDDIHFSQF